MENLQLTVALYRSAFRQGAERSIANWPVLATVFVYVLAQALAASFLFALGILGGLLLTLIRAACLSSFLYMVERIVRGSRVDFDDFRRSFGAYLWDVVGVMFLLWIFSLLVVPVVRASPQGVAILLSLQLVGFVLFNAVPELIYLGHHTLFALLGESYSFITENWLEWFPGNIVLAVGLWALLAVPAPGILGVVKLAALAFYLYFAMVVRGLLFQELHGTTRRARLFRHRAGS